MSKRRGGWRNEGVIGLELVTVRPGLVCSAYVDLRRRVLGALDADNEHISTYPNSIGPDHKASTLGARVLIVDDAQDTREMFATFLRFEGFQVAIAEDGVTGLTFAQQHRLDIIILDLAMPRMNGFEVTRRLRADDRTKRVPIIIFSGFERDTDIADAIAAGADVCCVKPCLPETLLGVINKLLLRLRGTASK